MIVGSSQQGKGGKMYKNILIATDGTELAGKALTHGLALAKAIGARVTLVTVTEMWSALEMASRARTEARAPVETYESMASEYARKILDAAAEKAKAEGVEHSTHHVSDRHPSDGILDAAKQDGCDLVVMASHGRRGLDRLLLGSETVEVLTYSKVPVLVVR